MFFKKFDKVYICKDKKQKFFDVKPSMFSNLKNVTLIYISKIKKYRKHLITSFDFTKKIVVQLTELVKNKVLTKLKENEPK